jgi:hypothetical protein
VHAYRTKALNQIEDGLLQAEAYLATYPIRELAELINQALKALKPYLCKRRKIVRKVVFLNDSTVAFWRSGAIENRYADISPASHSRLKETVSYRRGLWSEDMSDGSTVWTVMEPEAIGLGMQLNIDRMYSRFGIDNWDMGRIVAETEVMRSLHGRSD